MINLLKVKKSLVVLKFNCSLDSSEEEDEFIASLKKTRRKIFSETPLLVLTINSIIKNHLHFMGLPKNPFEYLRKYIHTHFYA